MQNNFNLETVFSTCFGGLGWSLVVAWVILVPDTAARFHTAEISLVYPAYYIALSAWLGRWDKGPHRT